MHAVYNSCMKKEDNKDRKCVGVSPMYINQYILQFNIGIFQY